MGFAVYMFVCNLLIPLVMIIAGYMMYKHPPKDINGFVGYRTRRSRQNENTWAYAHNVCGKMWLKWGLIMLLPSVLIQLPFIHSDENTLSVLTVIIETVQIAVLLGTTYLVEKALKEKFGE